METRPRAIAKIMFAMAVGCCAVTYWCFFTRHHEIGAEQLVGLLTGAFAVDFVVQGVQAETAEEPARELRRAT